MDVKATWKGGLTFTASSGSGVEIPLRDSAHVDGDNDGVTPMELIAIGLAGCTGMDVISILQKKRQVITAFEVEVHTKLAEEHPRVFTEAEILYKISGENVQEKAVMRAIELSGKNYCPVHAMLGQVMPIILKYQIYEHKVNVVPDLVVSGACDINLDP